MRVLKRKRGVSPVIATVILIAVAVSVGIAVAFWGGALTTNFSRYEELVVITASYAERTDSPVTGWTINMSGVNKGSSPAVVVELLAAGTPLAQTSYGSLTAGEQWYMSVSGSGSSGNTIGSGGSFTIVVLLDDSSFSSGQTVQVAVMTAKGIGYVRTVQLP